MLELEAQIRATLPDATIIRHVPGDSFFVDVGNVTFCLARPWSRSYETKAAWPVTVTLVPSPEPKSWECQTLADVMETLRWPAIVPAVRTVTMAQLRARAGMVSPPWARAS